MSVKIGCVADTHIPTRASKIPEKLYETFNSEEIKFIFFAGDLVTLQVIDDLEMHTNVEKIIVVHGNMDKYEVKKKFPQLEEIEILGQTIKMAHKLNHIPIKETKVNLAIYGHTHKHRISQKGHIKLVNPGSGTGSGIFTARSVGIVHITKENILPKIVQF
ncbi:MAG: metallophosphoesterase family protein [Promethearchaeota archaeon]